MKVLNNKARYLIDKNGIIGYPKEPIGFQLGIVAIRNDGWVALVDIRAEAAFIKEMGDLEWVAITKIS